MDKSTKEFVKIAIGVVEELNGFDKYCHDTNCKVCPLNLNPDDCEIVDKLRDNLIEGVELVIQKLKQ